jgi:hypothetical protein
LIYPVFFEKIKVQTQSDYLFTFPLVSSLRGTITSGKKNLWVPEVPLYERDKGPPVYTVFITLYDGGRDPHILYLHLFDTWERVLQKGSLTVKLCGGLVSFHVGSRSC